MIYKNMLEEVNNPKHYNSHESGIEAINICRNLPNDLGNAWKYSMRYEDKEVPKKDLNKLCWYLNDFYTHFIDDNNECTEEIKVSESVLLDMDKVILAEPVQEVKNVFILIKSIIVEGGILNPTFYNETITNIRKYAEQFSA